MLFEDEDKMIALDGDNIKVVDRFSYLGDVISMEGGAQEAVTSRISRGGVLEDVLGLEDVLEDRF